MRRYAARSIGESRAVIDVAARRHFVWQVEIESDVQGLTLIVIQREEAAGRGRPREIGQTSADGAGRERVGVGIREIDLAPMEELRRTNGNLPTVEPRVVDADREEDIRVANRIVIEVVPGALVI